MRKKIELYYQDCAVCGARRNWGIEQTKIANDNGFEIVKVPFYKSGAKEVIWKATKAGMSLPFFTDGEKFSKNVADFVEAPKTEKKSKKRTKKVEEDGVLAETA